LSTTRSHHIPPRSPSSLPIGAATHWIYFTTLTYTGPDEKIFQVPVSWFNFITVILVTPEKFNWAKYFLSSALWKIILEESAQEESIKFIVPEKCSVQFKSSCCLLDSSEEENAAENVGGLQVLGEEPSTPLAPRRKRRPNSLLVESKVRRNPRIIELNGGFKNHDNCASKNCLSCNSAPLGLNGKVVKILVVSFYKVQEKDLDRKLKKKSKDQEKSKEEAGQPRVSPKGKTAKKGKEVEAAGTSAHQQKKKKTN
jgi:hypothetical protein